MKTFAVLCNLLSVAFTCLVIGTDGPPTKTAYIIFGALLLLVPVFSVVALVRSGAVRAWLSGGAGKGVPAASPAGSGALERAAAISNLVLIACLAAAIVDQYPHPNEEGYLAYVVLMLFTPVLSAVVLFLAARRAAPAGRLSAI